MYSMGRLEKPVLTEEGWQVQPSHPATEHERMIGASEMRSAFQSMLQSGERLPEEVARDVAHWLLVLNDGRATGIFIPLALAADGSPATIDSATPDAIADRIEIAASLESLGSVPAGYVPAFLDALHRADRGRLSGLIAPGIADISEFTRSASESLKNIAIPGKWPKVRIGQIAVEIAWDIEITTKRIATAKEVMDRMQMLANKGEYADVLRRSIHGEPTVEWTTSKSAAKKYGIDACATTLKVWHESRR